MNRIAELREETGVTQSQLAEHIGVSQSSLSRWELEVNFIDVISAEKLADYFNVTIDYLCARSDLPRAAQITLKESELLDIFRSLTQKKQEAIYNSVKILSK